MYEMTHQLKCSDDERYTQLSELTMPGQRARRHLLDGARIPEDVW